ncbi:hypothetical protein EDB86DRAFT_3210937 [Lactarius hatsudake]|nr:hypothetical protein EDB86DRAFT_3210937 [Lactarius hatsudake]
MPTRPLAFPLCAAPTRGLSDSSAMCRRQWWPPLRVFVSRGSVRDCLQLPVTTQTSKAPCGPLSLFPTSLYPCAASATQAQRVATSEKYRVARKRARLSAIACDHPTQQGSVYPTVPVPDRAALVRSLSSSTVTRLLPPQTYLRHLAPRGGLRAHLRHFTPPNPAIYAHSSLCLLIVSLVHFIRFDALHISRISTLSRSPGSPSVQHLRAALETQGRRITDRGDHLSEVSRPADENSLVIHLRGIRADYQHSPNTDSEAAHTTETLGDEYFLSGPTKVSCRLSAKASQTAPATGFADSCDGPMDREQVVRITPVFQSSDLQLDLTCQPIDPLSLLQSPPLGVLQSASYTIFPRMGGVNQVKPDSVEEESSHRETEMTYPNAGDAFGP